MVAPAEDLIADIPQDSCDHHSNKQYIRRCQSQKAVFGNRKPPAVPGFSNGDVTKSPYRHMPSPLAAHNDSSTAPKSLRSTNSCESFQSALTSQEAEPCPNFALDTIHGVIHAFRTALAICQTLIRSRIHDQQTDIIHHAQLLEKCLVKSAEDIGRWCETNLITGSDHNNANALTKSGMFFHLLRIITNDLR